MVIKPSNLSILELVFVELGESIFHYPKLSGDFALWYILIRPMSGCENFGCKINVLVSAQLVVVLSVLELSYDIFRLHHILEHSLDTIDGVVAALNLKFLDHELLSFI